MDGVTVKVGRIRESVTLMAQQGFPTIAPVAEQIEVLTTPAAPATDPAHFKTKTACVDNSLFKVVQPGDCQVGDGATYRGTVSVTGTGNTCQRWDSQTPHEHSATPAKYPSSGLDHSYCRNPDGERGVWCYTTDPSTRWGYCDVCVVQPGDCQVGDGATYRGTVSVTGTGKTCQRWDSQTPHAHDRTHANYPSSGLDHSYCRNPDGEHGVWCYTTDPNTVWEYCDVCACYWEGTAVFCDPGDCDRGSYVRSDKCGDGLCCWTGTKIYCCNGV
ncbi:plasminogen-like [Branchiostoma lanceolatum]|uniref:plasminogen-like n=1 Tax=Branchiostoma lanceolatum TaxID=7740 RepID=UPI003454AD60